MLEVVTLLVGKEAAVAAQEGAQRPGREEGSWAGARQGQADTSTPPLLRLVAGGGGRKSQ